MSIDDPLPVDIVVRHPAVRELGRDEPDQQRAEAFAKDLARWLFGRSPSELGPLARVVTVVAQRELRPTRHICRDRPLMAVEAAARATAALWPLLRDAATPPEEEEEAPPPEGGGGEGGEEAEAGEQEGGGGQEQEEEEEGEQPDPDEMLEKMLGDLAQADDPDLDSLIEKLKSNLSEGTDAGEAAAEALADVSQAAAEGAIHTDRVARQLERFLPGIGWSSAPGQLELALLERLDQLARLLQELHGLDELADALGRLEDATRREGRKVGGREEVVGVRFGGEVSQALPAELALLGDEDTEDLFYQRLLERRLVSLELTGAGDEGAAQGGRRGPVIACIDTSASMEGPPELAAKALVLAVCRKVIPRGRVVHLILFGGPGERTELRLRRGLGGLEGMLAFLQRSFHSGTDFDGPLLRAMDLLEEAELDLADVLVVTDGLCRAAPEVVDRVKEVRDRRGVRIWSVVLGHRDTRGVDPFSDEVLRIDPNQAASAAGLVRAMGR
jgi:uncharacterized protein with von Willebrand factor type A (vWA) domain